MKRFILFFWILLSVFCFNSCSLLEPNTEGGRISVRLPGSSDGRAIANTYYDRSDAAKFEITVVSGSYKETLSGIEGDVLLFEDVPAGKCKVIGRAYKEDENVLVAEKTEYFVVVPNDVVECPIALKLLPSGKKEVSNFSLDGSPAYVDGVLQRGTRIIEEYNDDTTETADLVDYIDYYPIPLESKTEIDGVEYNMIGECEVTIEGQTTNVVYYRSFIPPELKMVKTATAAGVTLSLEAIVPQYVTYHGDYELVVPYKFLYKWDDDEEYSEEKKSIVVEPADTAVVHICKVKIDSDGMYYPYLKASYDISSKEYTASYSVKSETVQVRTFEELKTAAGSGVQKIIVMNDIECSGAVELSGTVALEGVDDSIVLKRTTANNDLITCKAGSKVSLKNLNLDGNNLSGIIVNSNIAQFNAENCKFYKNGESTNGVLYLFKSSGEITDCTVGGSEENKNACCGINVNTYGNFTFRRCTVSYNDYSGTTDRGAFYIAIGKDTVSRIDIIDSEISYNTMKKGGGIYVKNAGIVENTVTVDGCTISHNTTSGAGAGICLEDYSSGSLVFNLGGENKTYISNNSTTGDTSAGAGVYASKVATLNIKNVEISENTTPGSGATAGLYLGSNVSTVNFGTGVILKGNKASGSLYNAYFTNAVTAFGTSYSAKSELKVDVGY